MFGKCIAAVAAMGIALEAHNVDHATDSGPVVEVHVVASSTVPPPVDVRAQITASEILASAGVHLQWMMTGAKPPGTSCPADGPAATITIRFQVHASRGLGDGAYAAAKPFARDAANIDVFYDRMKPDLVMVYRPDLLPGHVLAHEIGHELMRTVAHSEADLKGIVGASRRIMPIRSGGPLEEQCRPGRSCYSWLACASH